MAKNTSTSADSALECQPGGEEGAVLSGARGYGSVLSAAPIRSVGKIVLGSILDVVVQKCWVDMNPVVKAKVSHNWAVQRRIF